MPLGSSHDAIAPDARPLRPREHARDSSGSTDRRPPRRAALRRLGIDGHSLDGERSRRDLRRLSRRPAGGGVERPPGRESTRRQPDRLEADPPRALAAGVGARAHGAAMRGAGSAAVPPVQRRRGARNRARLTSMAHERKVMAKPIDRALRRELISLAAERFWQRKGVRTSGPVHLLACPTCGTWPRDHAASSHQPRRSNPGRSQPNSPK